jgi:hypothetical protein
LRIGRVRSRRACPARSRRDLLLIS